MNDPRLEGIVNNFSDKFSLDNKLNFSDKYQYFVNYIILKKKYYDAYNVYPYESEIDSQILDNINFGRNCTMAVDGCIILYNNKIRHTGFDIDDIKEELSQLKNSDIIYVILVETKSGDFDANSILKISECLKMNYTEQKNWEKLSKFREVYNNILKINHSIKINFSVIFITGNDQEQNILDNKSDTLPMKLKSLKQEMKSYFWIDEDEYISVIHYNSVNMRNEYDSQLNNSKKIDKTISFRSATSEIPFETNEKVIFGVFRIEEIMKILYDRDRKKPNDLYGYNVRGVVENSNINIKIEDSIKSNKDKFLLLNNGITMVVDECKRTGENSFSLQNIRIVNGCQTSHSIINVCKNTNEYNDVCVSLKIIVTNEDKLLSDITFSSNNQNKVKQENLLSLEPNIFKLEKAYEDFFISYPKTIFNEIHLERRQGQYSGTNKNIIDILAQAKIFVSLWNKKPDEALKYANENLVTFQTSIKNDEMAVDKALVAGVFWNIILKNIEKAYYNARYHIFSCIVLMLIETKYNVDILNNNLDDLIKDIDLKDFLIKSDIDIISELALVYDAIEALNIEKLKSGKYQYRKFYPVIIFEKMYIEYKKIKEKPV